jgi:hypothetical protein
LLGVVHDDHRFLETGESVYGSVEYDLSEISFNVLVRSPARVLVFSNNLVVLVGDGLIQRYGEPRFILLFEIEVAVSDDAIEPGTEGAVAFEISDCVVDPDEGIGNHVGGFVWISGQSESILVGSLLIFTDEFIQRGAVSALSPFNQDSIVLINICQIFPT